MKHPILTGATAAAATAAAVMLFASPAIAATTNSSASPAPSTAATTCDRTAWQSEVQGTPSLKAGAVTGAYLWHNATGFHLRVTHPGHQRVVFTGEITSSSAMSLTPFKLEKGDLARLSANHKTLVFALSNFGYLDGVNFHTDCAATLAVSHLNVGNKALPAHNVFLGEHKAHPSQVPFVLHRRTTV